jgi:hypothetical protein
MNLCLRKVRRYLQHFHLAKMFLGSFPIFFFLIIIITLLLFDLINLWLSWQLTLDNLWMI